MASLLIDGTVSGHLKCPLGYPTSDMSAGSEQYHGEELEEGPLFRRGHWYKTFLFVFPNLSYHYLLEHSFASTRTTPVASRTKDHSIQFALSHLLYLTRTKLTSPQRTFPSSTEQRPFLSHPDFLSSKHKAHSESPLSVQDTIEKGNREI